LICIPYFPDGEKDWCLRVSGLWRPRRHKPPTLGALVNTVRLYTEIAPWTFGVRALYANLVTCGLLGA